MGHPGHAPHLGSVRRGRGLISGLVDAGSRSFTAWPCRIAGFRGVSLSQGGQFAAPFSSVSPVVSWIPEYHSISLPEKRHESTLIRSDFVSSPSPCFSLLLALSVSVPAFGAPDFKRDAKAAMDKEDWAALEKLARDELAKDETFAGARAFLAVAYAGQRKFPRMRGRAEGDPGRGGDRSRGAWRGFRILSRRRSTWST